MTATQGNLAALSRFIFRTPRWWTSLAFVLAIAAVVGAGVFDNRFWLEDVWQGVFFVGVPTVVASVLTSVVDRRLGGQLTQSRSSLLALTCELFVVSCLAVAGVVVVLTGYGQPFVFDVLLIALAGIFAFRLLVVMAVSRHRMLVAAVPASVQTLAAALLLFVYSGTMRFLEVGGPLVEPYLSRPDEAPPMLQTVVPTDFLVLGLFCLIYAAGVFVFVNVLDRPWERSLGVSVLEFVGSFVGHVAEGTRDLEQFFEQIGEDAIVPVTVWSIRQPDGTEKARFVLPMIHPGPMGEIGGGNLPTRVAASTDGMAFPPHATAGHDFNLVTEREVDTIISAANSALESLPTGSTASESVRVRVGETTVLGQAIDDDLVLVVTHSPSFADDIDYAVGLSTIAEARTAGFDDVLLVDAHNCNDGLEGDDLGHVVPGSQRSFDLMEAARQVATELADTPQRAVRVGTAWDETPWSPEEGIGPLGVRVAVFEVGEQRTAYVLVDGNNMEPGLRERIVDTLESVDEAEVMTTDTHLVNRVESVNQVGGAIAHDDLVALVERLVDDAIADLEPVELGLATERTEVTVFGNDRTETLASHANAAVSMGGALAVIVTIAAVSVSLLVYAVT
ncbi:DUF2070 family protein [Natribaculum luteum]|uniref:DUF2070 family protein n=1 Tax=Natribaculum luteum TaxID=1586232 RepID=A0ABD5P3A2_9EURY|nr:DUF2070 family protein [Natribaculum luteum]